MSPCGLSPTTWRGPLKVLMRAEFGDGNAVAAPRPISLPFNW
jgi:hypothetical protein